MPDQNTRDVFIAGVGIHPFGRFDTKTFEEMGISAITSALSDAGMTVGDIEMGLCSNVYLPMSTGLQVMKRMGRTGIPISDLDASCAAGVLGLELGQSLIRSGEKDIVLAFGVEKMPRGFMDPTNIYPEWMSYMGLTQNPQYWALNARRHMYEYGTTEKQIATVAVKNHRNGSYNPNAHYNEEFTIDEVLQSKVVCDPLRLYEICSPNEGAAAAILCSRNTLDSLRVKQPILLRASVHKTAKFPVSQAASFCTTPTDNQSVHRDTAQAAYDTAEVEPESIDVAEVQDTDAFSEIEAYEELGFCGRGEGGKLVERGVTDRGGDIPVNPSGGLISKGEPVGASHLGQVHELVTQIRGDAGKRQIAEPSIGLAHVFGAYGQCGITILGEDPSHPPP